MLNPGETVTVWLVMSQCATGTYIDGAYTDLQQAKDALAWNIDADRNNSTHWLREIETKPHKGAVP
jgi:hypothetical protein